MARVSITNRLPRRGEHSALPWQKRLEHETDAEYVERLVTALEDRFDDIVRAVNVSDEEIGAVGAGVSDGDKGDITVTVGGTVWTIDPAVVTYAKIQNVTAARVLGRETSGAGSAQELTLGTGLSLTGTVLDAVPTVIPTPTIEFSVDGTSVGTRSQLNFAADDDDEIEWRVADDSVNDRVNVRVELTSLAQRFRRLLYAFANMTDEVPDGLEDDFEMAEAELT